MASAGHKRGRDDDLEKETKKAKVESQRDIFPVAAYQDSDPVSNTELDSTSDREEVGEEEEEAGHKRGRDDDLEKETKKANVVSLGDVFHVASYQDSDPDSITDSDSTSDTEEAVVEEESVEEETLSTVTECDSISSELSEPEVEVAQGITMPEFDRCKLELKTEQAKVADLEEKFVQQSIIKEVMKYQLSLYTSKFQD